MTDDILQHANKLMADCTSATVAKFSAQLYVTQVGHAHMGHERAQSVFKAIAAWKHVEPS